MQSSFKIEVFIIFRLQIHCGCTPASTRQMVEIMQEHGEVVAMLGSSANFHNIQSFLVADASLAVEPLYPQVISCVLSVC